MSRTRGSPAIGGRRLHGQTNTSARDTLLRGQGAHGRFPVGDASQKIAAHEAEGEHRGNRPVRVGPELAQLTRGR